MEIEHVSIRYDYDPKLIKTPQELIQRISDVFCYYSDEYLLTEESGKETKKLHFHGYMKLKVPKTIHAVQTYFKRKFPEYVGNNGKKSVTTTRDVENYLSYIMKDGMVKLVKDIDLCEIPEWKPVEELLKKSNRVYGQLLIYLQQQKIQPETLRECGKAVFKFFRDSEKLIDHNLMIKYARTLHTKFSYDDAEANFLDHLLR